MTTRQRSSLTPAIAGYCDGDGPDMLLIHGVGMNADYWGNLIPTLSEQFRLTVIDMPGHGNSLPIPVASPALHDYSDVIAQTITRPAIVVGHSMGALIALDLAVRHPQQVSGIGVLNGIYRRSKDATRAIVSRVEQLVNATTIDSSQTLERWFGKSPQGINASARDQSMQWLGNINPQHYAAAYSAFAHADAPTDAQLAAIQQPALFLTGELEPNSTPAMSKAMAALTAQSVCGIVAGAKHMMSLTHPTAVEAAIISFFGTQPNAR